MGTEFPHLLSPMTIGKVTFKNRLCVAPMGDGPYGNLFGAHGEINHNGLENMAERARGGWGLFFSGCLITDYKVDPHDPHCSFMLHKPDFRKRAMRINELADYHGMKIIQQITAGQGRNQLGGFSCSPNPVFGVPGEYSPVLTKDQIKMKIDCVIEGAQLMKSSGFVGVEVHALHWGYLLDQFAMSITNKREDEYGGSLENRLRICKEIVEGIKQTCGSDFLVSMRFGLKSYISGFEKPNLTGENDAGRTIEEAVRIANLLELYGYDMLDVDAGLYDSFYYASAPMYMPQGYVIPLAEKVKESVGIPVLCGSRMDDPYMADKAIADGKIDAAVLGRPSLADPYYAKKVEMGRVDKIRPCIACNVGCMGKLRNGEHTSCAVNPTLRKEGYYRAEKALVSKKIAVIGGGLAGMEVARTAAMRGHDVTIYEKSGQLGGLLNPAGAHDFKKEIRKLKEWYEGEIRDLNIPVCYHTEMTKEKLLELKPDIAVFAVGSQPVMPKIEGIDHPKCIAGPEALDGKGEIGQKVAVVGAGLTGCEIAIDYAKQGKEVTLIEAGSAPLGESKMINVMTRQMIPDLLDHYHVNLMMDHRIKAVTDAGAVVVSGSGEEKTVEADTVIMSIGMRPVHTFEEDLKGSGIETHSIGDCHEVGNIYTVINGSYEVARSL